jgi:hypothetical protein
MMAMKPLRVCLFAFALVAAARAAEPPDAGPAPSAAGVFKLLMWYDRARPFDSFQYRAYDVERGEYTKAVEDWVALVRREYPHYAVSVRDVTVAPGDPPTTIARVAEDEKLALARLILRRYSIGGDFGRFGYNSGYSGIGTRPGAAPGASPSPFANPIPRAFPPLGAAGTTPPPSYPFPHPMPYPRPHP